MYLTHEQVAATLRKAWKSSRRDHLMLLLAFGHGLRVSEVASLRVGDVLGGSITVTRAKGSLKTTQPLLASADPIFDELGALREWLDENSDADSLLGDRRPLFGVTDRQIRRLTTEYMLQAGVDRELAHPHSLKHACGSLMYRSGEADIVAVAQYLGHKDIKNTRIYVNLTDVEASAVAAKAFAKMEAM